MAWLEIIEIRTVGSNRELLDTQLQDLIEELKQDKDLQATKVFRHVLLETDFSIHLVHDSQKADTRCSSICTRLVSSLKDFGLVNHTIWIEKSNGGDRNETQN